MAEAATETIPMVPKEWPGAFGLYKHAKQIVMFNLGTIICVLLASIAVSLIGEQDQFGSAGDLLSFVASSLLSASLVLTYLAGVRKKKLSFDESLKKAWPFLVKVMLFGLLIGVLLLISFLLFIVPFFIVLPRIAAANYYLIDKKMGVVESIKASWEASRGHAGKVWGIIGASVLMALLAVTIIGIPFAIYFLVMYSSALVIFYEYIEKHKPVVAKS